jgi:oligopeptide/dipeptide ABC transporter ATP-binding protein
MELGLGAAFVAGIVGIPIGAASVLLPAAGRAVFQRLLETLLSFPPVIVAIFLTAIIGPGPAGAAVGVGTALSFQFARIASVLALSIGDREYVAAARILGLRPGAVLSRYVVPNIAEPLIVVSTVAVSTSLVSVASLSFLGIGVQPPQFDWGRMLTDGLQSFYVTPATALGPAAAIALSALSFGLAGEAFARATNPLLWTQSRAFQLPRRRANGPRAKESSNLHVHTLDTVGDLVLRVANLFVTYQGPKGPILAVADLNLELHRGETVGLVGESGSGKSSVALAVAQLTPSSAAVSGEIYIRPSVHTPPRRTSLIAAALAIVFQDPMTSMNPALKIGTQMTEGPEWNYRLPHTEAVTSAVAQLQAVHIANPGDFLNRYPHQLSGGMLQRAVMAMGLLKRPAVLVADEPTTALDVTIQAQILSVLQEIGDQHEMAILLISHNFGVVAQLCDRVLVMYAGRVVEEAPTQELIASPLHPYTTALLGSVPDLVHPRGTRLNSVPGQSPDLSSLPSGCAFHPRCPLAFDRCSSERPELTVLDDGRRVACWAVTK